MSSVVLFRNSLGKTQVLQESVNNTVNINNNDVNQNIRREIIIVRKKQRLPTSTAVSVTSLLRATEPIASNLSPAKKQRLRETSVDESTRAPTPLAVARRNARERNRVRQVNDGFAALRRHIPDEVAAAFESANSNRGPNKKLSKVETLRMAVEYIRNLESLLNIGHTDKENSTQPSMESFPSPASSSPRDNSQERSYFSMNSPGLDDEDIDEDEIDGGMQHLTHQNYVELSGSETFQLVTTPHLYEEEPLGPPLTPASDLLAQDEVGSHILDEHFQFPTSSEQFTVIPEQNYLSESDILVKESDFEVKYADSIQQQQTQHNFSNETELTYQSIVPDLILSNEYKFKEEDRFIDADKYTDVELKKELPDIQVTPEDREQFEETLKWWQEKTKQPIKPKSIIKNN